MDSSDKEIADIKIDIQSSET